MFQLEKLLGARTTITIDQANRIRELVADWQLLADLSFADLILWVPIRKDISMWPTGHIAVAHIRPTTTSREPFRTRMLVHSLSQRHVLAMD